MVNLETGVTDISTATVLLNLKENWIYIAIVVFVVAVIILVVRFSSLKIKSMIENKIGEEKVEVRKKTFTINSVLSNLISVTSIFIGLLIIADQLGISIIPIVTGAGIIGIVIGLGAQSLIKDLINGSFILFEQWYQINDIITVSGISGVVEKFSLRTTVIRDLGGVVHYIPNSEIKILSNRTQEWARAVIDVSVHYKENTDKVVEVLNQVFEEFMHDENYNKFLLETPAILGDGGISELGASAIVFKVTVKVKPPNQWTIERQLRKRIKDKFDEVGIEIPYPCSNLYIRSETQNIIETDN